MVQVQCRHRTIKLIARKPFNMKNRLGDMMARISQESTDVLDPSQVGAAEVLVTTDEVTTELEESIEELADTVNEKAETEAVIEKIVDATESLESSLRFIQSMEDAGQPLSGSAYAIWQRNVRESFEARQIPDDVFAGALDNLQTSFESNTTKDYTIEAKEAGKGILARIGEMLKKAWEWLRQTAVRLYTQVTTSTKKLKEAATKLKASAANLKEGTATRKILLGAYGDIMVGGKPAVAPVLVRVTNAVDKMTKDVASIMTNVDAAKTALSSGAEKVGVASPWTSTFEVEFGGNSKLVVGITDGKIFKSSKSVTVKMERGAKAESQGSADPMTVQGIKDTCDKIIKLATAVEANSSSLQGMTGANKEFKAGGEGNQELATAIAATLSIASKVTQLVQGESLKVAKKAYTFALQSAKMRAGGKAVSEGEGSGE